jgi:hypothetical protein
MMQIVNDPWDAFIQKLTIAKAEKIIGKFSVPAFTTLIYGGAVDELLSERLDCQNRLDVYYNAYLEVKHAVDSKAGLPKKSKTAKIGISDIKTEAHLAMWRQTNSPIGVYPFLRSMTENLKGLGFAYDEIKNYFIKRADKGVVHIATDEYQRIFSFVGTEFWSRIRQEKYIFHIIGVVTDKQVRLWSNNTKEMMKLSIFTGKENINDLIIWPPYGENEVDPFLKINIEVGNIYLFRILPKVDGEKQSATIKEVKKFQT